MKVGAKTLFANSRMDKGKSPQSIPIKPVWPYKNRAARRDSKWKTEVLRF